MTVLLIRPNPRYIEPSSNYHSVCSKSSSGRNKNEHQYLDELCLKNQLNRQSISRKNSVKRGHVVAYIDTVDIHSDHNVYQR